MGQSIDPQLPSIILAIAIAIAIILLAVAAFFSIKNEGSGWSFDLTFSRRRKPPLDHDGSAALPCQETTEAPSPDEQEHP